jgi:TatD DNase family protein
VLIDTHCHLTDGQFDADRAEVVTRARAAGVGHVVVVADQVASSAEAVAVARAFGLSATVGVHPHEAASWSVGTAARIEALLDEPEVVAVGETGLDYHYDHSPRDAQRKAFADQLALAARRDLPAVVHCRDADDDMAAMLRDTDARLVLHSFSAGQAVLDAALSKRYFVSFSGMVTFRSWRRADAVAAVPEDLLLVETDSPYLAPAPHRGARNEPAFVRHVAEQVAGLRDVTFERIAEITTSNAVRCFGDRLSDAS